MPTFFSGGGGASGGNLDIAIQDLALFGEHSWAMSDDEILTKLCSDPHAINSNMVNHFLGDYAIEYGQHIGNMVAKCNRIDDTIDWSNIPTTAELVTVPGAFSAVALNPSASSLLETFIVETLGDIENLPWETLAALVKSGALAKYCPIGATKDIVVGEETLTLEILGHNHDAPGTTSFGLKDLMATTRRMAATNTNVGGWSATETYGWLQNTLLPMLPSDLMGVIKTISKRTSVGNEVSTIEEVPCKLFQLSEVEIYGGTSKSFAGEGTQYDLYKERGITISNYANAIKKLANGTGSTNTYWQRSPLSSFASHFCGVFSDGSPFYTTASSAYGVWFGFAIG